MQPNRRPFVLLAAALSTLAVARAQCTNPWLSGGAVQGVGGTVFAATAWDPDGPGPAPSLVVVGGRFTVAGNVVTNNIAVHDVATNTWSALGGGVDGDVLALAALPNGELVAAGTFTTAGGVPARCLARWNGASWSPLGLALGGAMEVRALAVMANGDLVIGGRFSVAGRIANIARWNGATWSMLGGANGAVTSIAQLPNGDVAAAGHFDTIGTVAAQGIARWNGVTWSPLGTGLDYAANGGDRLVVAMPSGDVVVTGAVSGAGGAFSSVLRWNGTNWSSVGGGVWSMFTFPVRSALVRANGDLLVGGFSMAMPGAPMASVARWDGSAWSLLAQELQGPAWIHALASMPNGDLIVGGSMASAWPAMPGQGVVRWDGATVHALGSGTNGAATTAVVMPGGDVVIAGDFSTVESVPVNNVARWNGASWSPLGAGLPPGAMQLRARPNGDLVARLDDTSAFSPAPAAPLLRWNGTTWVALGTGWNGEVSTMAVLSNGDVVAGGTFTSVSGVAANRIARWDGTVWSSVGTGLPTAAGLLFERRNGALVAVVHLGSQPRVVMEWDGISWQTLGGTFDRSIHSLAESSSGELIAAGSFGTNGNLQLGCIARWDGTQWLPFGTGVYGGSGPTWVGGLVPRRNGDLVAFGLFAYAEGTSVNNIAAWNGTNWSALSWGTNGVVRTVLELPGGDLLVGGGFTTAGGQPAARLARWDGSAWSAVAAADEEVWDLVARPNGDVFAIGRFAAIGGAASAFHGTLTTSCPASATSSGSGCAGAAGPVALAATHLPWLGSTFRARTTGVPANAFAIGVYGFATASIPLASILPQGVAGCSLLATPDDLTLHLPIAGSVTTTLSIPNTTALVGASLHHQVAPVELGAGGAITAVTSSNALTLTLGTF